MGDKIVPIRGEFESVRALLYHVAEDDDIAMLVVFTVQKDGSAKLANFNMTRANMAYASVAMAARSLED